MKIKFFSNYDSSVNLLKRFRDNYPVNDNQLMLTTGDDYDVAVVFNRTSEYIKESVKIITIAQEPSFSPVWINNPFLEESDIFIIHDKSLFNIGKNVKVIELPSIMWFHDHIKYSFFMYSEKAKKKKKLSMIVSGINANIPNTNYTKRIDLVNKIINSDLNIDIYGKGLQINDKRYKGQLEYKFQGLMEYQYSISLENSCEQNYVSEKFIDPILCGSKPLYYGCPNIKEIYNPESYSLIDLDSPTIIEDIKELIKEVPDSDTLRKSKIKYFYKYNLYNKLKEILL